MITVNQAERCASSPSTNDHLVNLYARALHGIDPAMLDNSLQERTLYKGLSGLFLSSAPDGYEHAKNRIMVVGRETRGWNVLKNDPYDGLEDYIRRSVALHSSFQKSQQSRPLAKGCTFFNFMRAVAETSGRDGLIWANLFCFDFNRTNPMLGPHADIVKHYSELLLKAQIEALKPDIVIFANGASSAKVRAAYFPYKGMERVCFNSRNFTDHGISEKQLWTFEMADGLQSYRIQHPSAFSKQARAAREFLVRLLPVARLSCAG